MSDLKQLIDLRVGELLLEPDTLHKTKDAVLGHIWPLIEKKFEAFQFGQTQRQMELQRILTTHENKLSDLPDLKI
jgi:hypothetical protein